MFSFVEARADIKLPCNKPHVLLSFLLSSSSYPFMYSDILVMASLKCKEQSEGSWMLKMCGFNINCVIETWFYALSYTL